MNNPRVDIILLNWNGYEVTRECIESLRKATYPNFRIIIVDNASEDGSGALLHSEFPDYEYLQNESNMGFSRGCNVGMAHAVQTGADYVLLLNNDITVKPDFLEPLVDLAESSTDIGLISGKIFLGKETTTIWYAGGELSVLQGHPRIRCHLQPDTGQFDETTQTGMCTGAMMLVRRAVIERVGLLPEEYFFGQEEWDYSLSVRRAGFKLYYCPRSVVHHRADGSHHNTSPAFLYCGMRNRLIFQKKFLPQPVWPLWLAAYSLYVSLFARFRLRHDDYTMRAYRSSFRAALRDHRAAQTMRVSREDLTRFEQEFARQESLQAKSEC